MGTSLADLLAGIDMEGGENFCDSVYNFLKNQGKDINLLTNSGFGVWSQSDAAKGLATVTYDVGSAGGGDVPDVGDAATGAISGATGKIISYTITGGAFATNNAVGVLTLGAVTGCFQDNETINFTDGETALVNGDATIGVRNDPMNNNSVGLWADDGAGITLAFVAAEYSVTTTAINQRAWIAAAALTAGKIYKIELDIKDGTDSGIEIQGYFDDGAAQYGRIETTAAGWASVYWTFECATTTAAGLVGFRVIDNMTGSNIQIRRFSCYEITPCCTGVDTLAMDGWIKDTTADIYREHSGANVKDGSFYANKLVVTAASDFVRWPGAFFDNEEWYMQFQGRTVTIAKWVLTSTADHARLAITDSVGTTYSDYHTGGGTYEWLEVTRVIDAAATSVAFYVYGDVAPEVDGTTIIYHCQGIAVFGSSIGEDMYQPKSQEWIYLEANIPSTLQQVDYSDVATTGMNLEADTDGKLPKGAKAVQFLLNCRDSASGGGVTCFVAAFGQDTTEPMVRNRIDGVANDEPRERSERLGLNLDGDFRYQIQATGANTFDIVDWRYFAVQVS